MYPANFMLPAALVYCVMMMLPFETLMDAGSRRQVAATRPGFRDIVPGIGYFGAVPVQSLPYR